jgi:hypothetical protein
MVSRTAFSAWSARIRNVLSRARSAGDLGPREPPAVDVPEQVVLRTDVGIQLVDGIPDGSVMRTNVGPAAARTSHQLDLVASLNVAHHTFVRWLWSRDAMPCCNGC